jgi:glycosyltransferase A (GT-A) superfamily protein (DUF2064 family)
MPHGDRPSSLEERKMPSTATIVLLAKCPTPGLSKTRLIRCLGSASAAADLARALLCDVVLAINEIASVSSSEALFVRKLLVFAQSSSQSELEQILSSSESSKYSLRLDEWTLLPIPDKLGQTISGDHLTDILKFALEQARKHQSTSGPVLFFGMDTPILPTREIHAILARTNVASNHPKDASSSSSSSVAAFLCPANDGGYGMVSVPCTAPITIFDDIPWSTSLTALAQIKAFTDRNIPIVLGPLMFDIDDESDLQYYIQRWSLSSSSSTYNDHKHTNVNSPAEASNSFITYTSTQTKPSHNTILQQPSRWAMEHTTGMQSTDSSNVALLTDPSTSPNGRIQSAEECPHTRQMLQHLGLLS